MCVLQRCRQMPRVDSASRCEASVHHPRLSGIACPMLRPSSRTTRCPHSLKETRGASLRLKYLARWGARAAATRCKLLEELSYLCSASGYTAADSAVTAARTRRAPAPLWGWTQTTPTMLRPQVERRLGRALGAPSLRRCLCSHMQSSCCRAEEEERSQTLTLVRLFAVASRGRTRSKAAARMAALQRLSQQQQPDAAPSTHIYNITVAFACGCRASVECSGRPASNAQVATSCHSTGPVDGHDQDDGQFVVMLPIV